MAIFKCKMCGGDLEVNEKMTIGTCNYCGSIMTLPKVSDEVTANLFNRANNLRLKSEFDKALEVYERILDGDNSSAEAHWGIVLCKYGIEYIEDPKTCNRIPTCHRTLYESVLADADYLSALENADASAKALYEEEAKRISELQKDILAVVKNEKPFDVFICYKETDENGKRTKDSALANDIYHNLTQEGYKVFYAAITLEDKLGQEYEPYIFAALNSAKVMLAVGTKPENFNSPWVKNEWSRFLQLMKKERGRTLIPCFAGMDAYDLPEDFAHLQAQDMSKIGFINDLSRGIKKIVGAAEDKVAVGNITSATIQGNANIDNLLKRAFLYFEEGDFKSGNDYCERVLDLDVENAKAYVGKLMVEMQIKEESNLSQCTKRIENNSNFKKAIRFADEDYKALLNGYNEIISNRILTPEEIQYQKGINLLQKKDFEEAIEIFDSLGDFNDSITQLQNAKYDNAEELMNENKYMEAISLLSSLGDFKDSEEKIASIKRYLVKNANIGDIVYFGSYYQSNAISPQKELIPWIVLAKEYGKFLLISQKILEYEPYHNIMVDITWKDCSLRDWLNNDFYNLAFSDFEKKVIADIELINFTTYALWGKEKGAFNTKDRVFLLSIAELKKYFYSYSSRQASATEYAEAQGSINKDGNASWWLRSPGIYSYCAQYVSNDGNIYLDYCNSVSDISVGVRPAIWMKL